MTPHATVEHSFGDRHSWTVWAHWPGVDRPRTYGISVGPNLDTARRLAALMVAGRVFPGAYVARDVDGCTYVAGPSAVMGRTLHEDMARLEAIR